MAITAIGRFLAALMVGSLAASGNASESPRATIRGVAADERGKPLAHTTVLVYHAGVKKGYSTFCPSCYSDCGKKVVTDGKGKFLLKDLNPDLWFELLALREGYSAQFVKRVDPAQAPEVKVVLKTKPPSVDLSGVVRGRVVDLDGHPVRDAIVEPVGMIVGRTSMYGAIEGLEPMTVTNKKGEFELISQKPTPKMLLKVEARAMAPKFAVAETGGEQQSIALSDGAAISGRLLEGGRPVANAEVGLIAKKRGGFAGDLQVVGAPYDEVRIGTRGDGSFTITNVPEPGAWLLYAKMSSVAGKGATDPVEVETRREGEYVKAKDLGIGPGYRLRGHVVLSDGKPIPENTRVTVASVKVWDAQVVELARDGSFEVTDLPEGEYEISPGVKGYMVKGDARRPFAVAVNVSRDTEYEVTLYPVLPRSARP